MREIVWDTETTGLDFGSDRIVEIGAVELMNHLPTGNTFHRYINPGMPMPREAYEIHGLDDDFLANKPRFDAVVDEFMTFVGDAILIAHNAGFDMGMLNAELARLGRSSLPDARAIDSRALAQSRYPGAQSSLDALCRRFGVDTSARVKHGALLDSELLAEVYLELRGGRQQGLSLDATAGSGAGGSDTAGYRAPPRPNPLAPRITADEAAAHAAFIAEMGDAALWPR